MPQADRPHSSLLETSPLLGQNVSIPEENVNDTFYDSDDIESILTHGTFPPDSQPIPGSHPHDVEQQQEQQQEEEPRHRTPSKPHEGLPEMRKRMHIIFPALAIGVFLGAADQTIIVSSYERIGSELHALNLTSWIATAYFLTLTSFQPLYGKLSDIFGRKPCLIFCYAVFGLGCLGCGLARNMTELIAARAFAGIGGGGMNVVLMVLLSDIMTLRERGKWQGYTNIIWASGQSVGAPLGGVFADRLGWRWAFLFQAPLCLISIAAVWFGLHLPKKPGHELGWMKKLGRVDFLGALILTGATFSLLVALDRGSNVSWTAPISYGPLAASAGLAVMFVFVEMNVAKEPFAPGHIIFKRSMMAPYFCNFFGMSASTSAQFFTPLYLQAVGGLTATGAGFCLIPGAVAGVTGSLSTGIYMQKTGRYYWITVIAYGLLTIGLAAILNLSGLVVSSVPGTIFSMCFQTFGNSGGVTTTLTGLLASVAHEDQALVIACSYLFRSLGSVFGISMSATVANQVLKETLTSRLPELGLSEHKAFEIANRVRASLNYLIELKPDVRAVVTACYSRSVTAAFGFELGLAFCAFVAAWFTLEKPLSR